MPRGRITVRNRQRTTAFHHKDAVTICIVFILEYMTVQVKGHSSIDNQRGVNGNVSCQLDGFIRIMASAAVKSAAVETSAVPPAVSIGADSPSSAAAASI